MLVLPGCAAPLVDPVQRGEPALVEIQEAFVRAVDWARSHPHLDWTSGWTGNAIVGMTDETTVGLCYDWQELAWDFTCPAVERVGWRVDGIAINEETWSAHYAVVVWDPTRVRREQLLALPADAPAFVLDAWRNGEPEIYTVADWIKIPILVMEEPALENLRAEYGVSRKYGSAVSPGR